MRQIATNSLLVLGVSLVFGLAMTLLVRSIAWRLNFVAKPKSDRWHKRPTAMLGGAAIFAAVTIVYLIFVPHTHDSLVLVGCSTLLFLVGLVDDIVSIRPYQKLIGQLVGAVILVEFGLTLPITGNQIVDIWITVFWVVGITNAINLLDNMDGLAAGISAIAAVSLGLSFAANGQTNELLLIAAFVGALLGFLVFNINPASIFMGDCGSMFVGFFLAGSVLLNQVGGRSRGIVPILAVPVLILFVPIFDTTFVTVLRKLWGRKASQGGRDHTSHRLVALGLSERSAVLMLYAFATVAGSISLAIGRLEFTQSLALISIFSIILVIIGVYLSKVRVYDVEQEELAVSNNAVFAFLVNVSYKRRIFEVFLDALLITLSYYAAFLIVLGSFEGSPNWDLFLKSLPILIPLKLASFLVAGVYRGVWRYTSIRDLVSFAKGVVLGSLLSVLALLLLYRFEFFSRAVFIVDGLILLVALMGSRMAFRLIRLAIPLPTTGEGRKVLIYGAGDGGEMVFRELNNNPGWNYIPAGFIDDDPRKAGRIIHGLKVFDGSGGLSKICEKMDISDVLLSTNKMDRDRLRDLREICRDANVSLKRAQIRIEPVEFE
jgi:UDP-GlcNAc:undecaprenyl-phosphate/decaprenyl-phosphate GlcNAc-1-phosphate transferase